MEITIRCELIARFAHLLQPNEDQKFTCFRIEENMLIATDRKMLAVERIDTPSFNGAYHLIANPAMIAACGEHGKFGGMLEIVINDVLRFGTCKTTFGYADPTNCILWSDATSDFDKWRSIVPMQPADKNDGALYMETTALQRLAQSSPSGSVVFEKFINVYKPTLVRDIHDKSWFGVFWPRASQHQYEPAKLPGWFR